MDFDFIFKLIVTVCFFGVSTALVLKWAVGAYLDYVQVMEGIRIITMEEHKERDMRGDTDANY
jgi:hypothetical protein